MSDNTKIKIIELIPSLGMGGAETMVKDYCLLLNKEQFDVKLVVIDHQYNTPNEEAVKDSGVDVVYLSELLYGRDITGERGLTKRILRKASRYYFWIQIVKQYNPDIIHLHLHLDNYMKIIPIRSKQYKLVMTIHNTIDNFFSYDVKEFDKFKERREVYRLVHKHNMKLITLHDELVDELKEYFKTSNVEKLNNGIPLSRFKRDDIKRREVRAALEILDDDFLIGNVASFSYQKNHDLILEVFRKIALANPNVKLLLIGNGMLKDRVLHNIEENGVEERVTILSNRDDIPDLMNAMDVFFFPSRWEGFGNVMIEAQAIGLKCVVSDAVPDSTRVTNKVVVRKLTDSIDSWCEALMSDVSCEEKVMDIEEYNMINVVKKLENLYIKMLNS